MLQQLSKFLTVVDIKPCVGPSRLRSSRDFALTLALDFRLLSETGKLLSGSALYAPPPTFTSIVMAPAKSHDNCTTGAACIRV